MPPCRHCRKVISKLRPKRLCWVCYRTPEIFNAYSYICSTSQVKSIASDNQKTDPAKAPTFAQPGSEEKIAVMCQRAASGQEIFHPRDVTALVKFKDVEAFISQELDRIFEHVADQIVEAD